MVNYVVEYGDSHTGTSIVPDHIHTYTTANTYTYTHIHTQYPHLIYKCK